MRHIGRIAAELRRANPGKVTKKAVVDTLRAIDGLRAKEAEALYNDVLAETQKQSDTRHRKPLIRKHTAIPPWERGTPEDRLSAKIQAWSPVPYLMRRSPSYTTATNITGDPTKVNYTVTINQEWKKYGRKGWYKAVVDTHSITIPRWYISKVIKQGLRIVDSLPTLDAKKLDAPNGCELYAAKWARQGRGYQVHMETGYIARSGVQSFHGKTAKAALRGLERKIAGSRFDGCTMDQLAKAHPDQWVSLADLNAIGACLPGIQMWVERTGMQAHFMAGGATVQEIATGYAICPAPEARAAVLYSLRKRKAASV